MKLPAKHWQYWSGLLLAVVAIKAVLYWLDPSMMYFLGDSNSYLYSAATGWVPPDRSYEYGTFIRIVTRGGRYLDLLVPAQVAASAASCLVLGVLLVRFFDCSRPIAALAVLACALEPIQLMYERYVMTESLSLFVFALFLLTLMVYLRRNAWWLLVAAAGLAVVTVSLRTAYMPAVLGSGLLAVLYQWLVPPGGAYRGLDSVSRSKTGRNDEGATRPKRRWMAAVHLLAFLATFSLAYTWEERPRGSSDAGFFLLSAWGPVLAEEDYPLNPTMQELVAGLPEHCNLGGIHGRAVNLWYTDCLSAKIKERFADRNEANRFAAAEAFKALLYDPAAVFYLGFRTWAAVWDDGALSGIVRVDRGAYPDPPADFAEMVFNFYDKDISGWNNKTTLTNQYYYSASYWYRLVSLMPVLMLIWWWMTRRRLSPFSLIVTCSALLLLLTTSVIATNTTVRFYHGIGWLAIIALASSVSELAGWRRRAAARVEQAPG